MSVKVQNLVWESDVKEGRLVLLALADNATDGGYCYPGGSYLAGKTQMTRRSVFRCLSQLEEAGLVERRNRFRDNGSVRSNLYRINLTALAARKRKVAAAEQEELAAQFEELSDAPPDEPWVSGVA